MKKVLILAYDFPPYVSVGGLRPYNWYKYLQEFGVEPIVVTRQWRNEHGNYLDYISASKSTQTIMEISELGAIIRTPYTPNLANRLMLKYGESKYRLLRKSISAYYESAQWFWNTGPKSQLYISAHEYLKANKVDAIIATGDPFILFKYASKLSKQFNTPWIADYRDPWTQNIANNRNIITKTWSKYFEKKIVKSASSICTVSEFVKSNIASLIKGKKFHMIPNGYDPEVIKKINDKKQKNVVLSIGFAGTIYPWHPVESFLEVISVFLSEKPDTKLKVEIYGVNIADELHEMIISNYPKIKQYITIFPKIQNELLLQKLAEDNIMLLFNDYSIMGTKIFDYIGIKRAVLLCYANDKEALKLKEKYYTVDDVDGLSQHLQEDLIKETNAGYIAQDAAHLKVLLSQLYDEFTQTGAIQCHTRNVEQYSRKAQTEELAKIIKELRVKSEELRVESSEYKVQGERCKVQGEREASVDSEQLAENSDQREAGLKDFRHDLRDLQDLREASLKSEESTVQGARCKVQGEEPPKVQGERCKVQGEREASIDSEQSSVNSDQREAGLESYRESSCAMNFPSFQGGKGVRDANLESSELRVESSEIQVSGSEFGSSFHEISFHEKSSYQQCTRCVMDTSDVDIHFDEQGVCNHCTNYFDRIASRVYQGEQSDAELLSLIEKIKASGKGRKYDCVIGVSGGIDSSYVAYKAKKRGLRALLVHLDNGWNSEISVKNIKNLANILGFDYESYVLDWEEFRDIQLAFLRASIPEMETPTDIAIPGALHQMAAKYGIKYIISGGNFATEGILPKTWHYNAKDFKYFKHIQKSFGTKKIRKFPFFGWKEESYYKLVKGIKMVYLLNYVPYNKQEAMQTLQDELGWRYYGGKHYESKYTGFVQSYIMPEKFNMDYRRATLSTQICTGEVTRDIALEELTHKPYDEVKSLEEKAYVCKKLGITVEEFDKIMSEPAKTYRDYPNAEKRLEFIYNIYRKVFKAPSYKGE